MNAEEETENWEPQHWSRQEWFYMWTKGLDPRRIAKICRVPYRKVYDHIRTRVNHNPALFGQRLMLHDHPQMPRWGLENRKPTWQERADELGSFLRINGRFPRGYVEDESKLYTFLQYQREKCRRGKLSGDQKSTLDEQVPGWLTLPKRERETALWEQRADELEDFLSKHGRYPSYKAANEPHEAVLATWVTAQRRSFRVGSLNPEREKRLDDVSPFWNLPSPHPRVSDPPGSTYI
ncbi:helicase associated domain-containing protein [Arthrobacter citreus]|uniref:helicase associated domain-containing protein n=1 Tax=Arthrobacter citreus TaxID=1670 RepID=UPI00382891AD